MAITLTRLAIGDTLKPICSKESDLNEFLRDDALDYLEDGQGITYLFADDDETICYCTILHDKLSLGDSHSDNKHWNKVTKAIQRHRRNSYPAVKIGKLATSAKYEGQGYARRMISLVQRIYTRPNQLAGCRFITVDALNIPDPTTEKRAVDFYQSLGFNLLTEEDINEETRYMAFDLQGILKTK